MPFPKGHKFAKGGRRAGSGRKPDWFKQEMEKIVGNRAAMKFIRDVAYGRKRDVGLSRLKAIFAAAEYVSPKADTNLNVKRGRIVVIISPEDKIEKE